MSSIRKSVRFKKKLYDDVEIYRKVHRLNTWSEALHARDEEREQKLQELTSELNSLKEKLINDKSLDPHMSIVNETQKRASMEFSEKPCHFMVYVNNEPKCADPDAPIDSYLKRHLNGQICTLCQEFKNKKLEEAKRKEQEQIKQFHEKTKKEVSFYQNRVKETISNKKLHRRTEPFTNEYGERIIP